MNDHARAFVSAQATGHLGRVCVGSLRTAAGIFGVFWGLSAVAQTAIYTCVDAKGRRITSDRPIAECMDREQRELNPSGSVKRVIIPIPTAAERAQQEAEKKAEAERQNRATEDKRKERLLASRYPNQAAHDKARAEAQEQLNGQIALAQQHMTALEQQRRAIDEELEFYKRDPGKAPPQLKRRLEENAQQRSTQSMQIADLEREKERINTRFDEELTQLRRIWGDKAP